MTPTAVEIYFHDEAPKIGCGWRRCNIEVGRKWVRITERATGARVRLPKSRLQTLKPRPVRRARS